MATTCGLGVAMTSGLRRLQRVSGAVAAVVAAGRRSANGGVYSRLDRRARASRTHARRPPPRAASVSRLSGLGQEAARRRRRRVGDPVGPVAVVGGRSRRSRPMGAAVAGGPARLVD